MNYRFDCRYFEGLKPCRFRRECLGCEHYAPFGKRILIIKLAAMGDVLRTTPLLRGLRAGDPGCHITWLTEANVIPLLQGIPEIDRLLTYSYETLLQLEMETFDEICCFDKEPKAAALAMKLRSGRKIGFGMSPYGNIIPLNEESEYAYQLGIDDPLKFRVNTKTYQELIYECAGISHAEAQEYCLADLSTEIREERRILHSIGVSPADLKIGLNTGAGELFASKKWTEEGYALLADRLIEELDARVLLLGGPEEVERNIRIAAAARHSLVNTGNGNPVREFAGIVGNCSLIVTGDTLALHIAIGLRVPVVAIFGPTCHQEIEFYGRGAKITSGFECSPCYLGTCPREFTCMDAIAADEVFRVTKKLVSDLRLTGGSRPQSQKVYRKMK